MTMVILLLPFVCSTKILTLQIPCMIAYNLSLQTIKETDITAYLKSIGHLPQQTKGNDLWYISPLHEEKTPSFKVNKMLNCWYDHSLGKGGNLVDFLLLHHGCSLRDLLRHPSRFFSFPQPSSTHPRSEYEAKKIQSVSEPQNEPSEGIKILSEKAITNSYLLSYLRSRSIPLSLAQQHLREIHYKLYKRPYYALGFRNDSGGYELRNKYFKGSSSPKDVTTFSSAQNKEELSVFEGFFSFLSYLALQEEKEVPLTNSLVLNSLSFFERSLNKMEAYPKVHLYLDNDNAGHQVTANALERDQRFTDKRSLYAGSKDFNEWLVQHRKAQTKQHRLHP